MGLDRNTAYGDEGFSDNRRPTFPGDMSIGWGFGREIEHCTGSPTCQCSDCRLTEYNSGEAPEDQQLPHGYKYESPEVKENREAGLYAMDESQPTDPLLAVSELEERVNQLGIELIQYRNVLFAKSERITDLEERLRSLTLVVNELYGFFNELEAQVAEEKE